LAHRPAQRISLWIILFWRYILHFRGNFKFLQASEVSMRLKKKAIRTTWVFLFAMMTAMHGPGALAQPTGDTHTMGVNTARALALQQGSLKLADAISSALLAKDPHDAEALIVRAQLLRAAGQLDAARAAAAAAYRNSENPALRFDAAMLAAGTLAQQERYSRSQVWLRRADQEAPDAPRQAAAAQAYAAVQRKNPLSISLRFSLKPSNNVNNGAETTEIEIAGFPFQINDSGQQLGGWEASAGASLSYRLSENETQRTDILGDIFYRRIWLNSEANALAPDANGSDFDYGTIVAGVRHQRLIWPELGRSSIRGVVGQSWYGGDALGRWGEVQLDQSVRRSENSALRFGLTARTEKRLDDEINDSEALGVSAVYDHDLGEGMNYSLGASARNVWSDSATVDSLVLGLNAGWTFGRVGPVQPRISLSAENRDYRKWAITPGGREDNTLSLRSDVAWPDLSYYGFVPQASLTARRTWSNVDIYDRNEFSLGLTAVSRF
jgi:tetratricopeptide (TPR) repeat protein